MKTSEKIIAYIKEKGEASVNELTAYLNISRVAVSKQLNNLMAESKVIKVGKPPKVFYLLKNGKIKEKKAILAPNIANIINRNYLIITPSGERKEGIDGFHYWCQKNNFPIEKNAREYAETLEKYASFKKNGLIDGMEKFKNTFARVCLDHIFYLDFYSIERFGKTKLGQILLYAKQSQDKRLMRELCDDIRPKVDKLMLKYKIDAIGFVPPTVKREVQFMKELEKNLHPVVKIISITKIKTEIIVPQKTLNKLGDRIENAQKTMIVNEAGKYKTVLLIDDAVGSGATLNEIACQIKNKNIAKKVVGLSITGSFKGFDVISEV